MSDPSSSPTSPTLPKRGWSWLRLLLLLPFIAVLWVPSYNTVEPTLFEVPFFYWYQMLWIVLCAVVIIIVYKAEN